MKTVVALIAALACSTALAQEPRKPVPPVAQEKKPPRIQNMGKMKNCPHETIEQRERRGDPLRELISPA